MISKRWMKFGAVAAVVVLLVAAGVAMAHGGRRGGPSVAYEGDIESGTVTNVTHNGTVLFESITYDTQAAHPVGRGHGIALYATNDTTVTLDLPDDATVVIHAAVADWSPNGATITYANGEKVNIVLENGTIGLDGSIVTLSLEAEGAALAFPVKAKFGFGHGVGMHGGGRGHGGDRGHR